MPIEITMPRLSDTMESGTVIKWNVKEGDKVSAGDVIADVETDKATMEMPVFDDGVISRLEVKEGQKVNVGTVIALLTGAGEDAATPAPAGKAEPVKTAKAESSSKSAVSAPAATVVDRPASAKATPKADSGDDEPADEANGADRKPSGGNGRIFVSPMARRLAEEHRLDIKSIEGSGPGGRIIKRDILAAVGAAKETSAAVPPSAKTQAVQRDEPQQVLATRVTSSTKESAPPTPWVGGVGMGGGLEAQIVPLSNMRQIIAKRLIESKTTIPHYQVTATFNMDPMLELRSTLNQQLEPMGVKLSVNDFLVRACALAIHQHPHFNAAWGEDHLEILADVNIGIAISLPIERGGGLVVATIRNADIKGLRHISLESKALAEKARTRGLTIQEMGDSTFTISNLGMFGVDNFTAIINPPNVAILAVGAAIEKPVVRDHQLTIGHEMNATLSCDHRVIDGAMAAQYMQTLRQLIENPGTLLV